MKDETDAASAAPEGNGDDDRDGGQTPADAERRVDEAWKRAARDEADKMDREAQAAEGGEGGGGGGGGEVPEANFATLLSGFATQALMNLGAMPNPFTGENSVDLGAARYTIDLLGVLEEKTRGNRDDEEERYFGAMLYDLRMRFVDESKKAGGSDADGGSDAEDTADAEDGNAGDVGAGGGGGGGGGILGPDGKPIS